MDKTDSQIEFYRILRGSSDSANYGLDESAFSQNEVSLSSDHAASRFFKEIKEKDKNDSCNRGYKCVGCGRIINKPKSGCSVYCVCGKINV